MRRLRDTFDHIQVQLHYSTQWPGRVAGVDRLYPDGSTERLVSYAHDGNGVLAEVRDGDDRLQRRFAYDQNRRMVEHQLPTGLRCFWTSTARWPTWPDDPTRLKSTLSWWTCCTACTSGSMARWH